MNFALVIYTKKTELEHIIFFLVYPWSSAAVEHINKTEQEQIILSLVYLWSSAAVKYINWYINKTEQEPINDYIIFGLFVIFCSSKIH